MNDKIKELKDLLFELNSKYSVSVPDTQQNINDATKKIVKLFTIPVVSGSYSLDFGGNCKAKIKIVNGEPIVEAAMNGWGDAISMNDIGVEKL